MIKHFTAAFFAILVILNGCESSNNTTPQENSTPEANIEMPASAPKAEILAPPVVPAPPPPLPASPAPIGSFIGANSVFDGFGSHRDRHQEECTDSGCVLDADCAEANPCTIDRCVEQKCVYTPIPGCAYCSTDADCLPGPSCTQTECCNSICSYPIIDDCIFLVAIALTPFSTNIPNLTDQQFVATGTYSNGTIIDITELASWSSTVPSVATVSDAPLSKGLASALAAGETRIVASFEGIIGFANLSVTGI